MHRINFSPHQYMKQNLQFSNPTVSNNIILKIQEFTTD